MGFRARTAPSRAARSQQCRSCMGNWGGPCEGLQGAASGQASGMAEACQQAEWLINGQKVTYLKVNFKFMSTLSRPRRLRHGKKCRTRWHIPETAKPDQSKCHSQPDRCSRTFSFSWRTKDLSLRSCPGFMPQRSYWARRGSTPLGVVFRQRYTFQRLHAETAIHLLESLMVCMCATTLVWSGARGTYIFLDAQGRLSSIPCHLGTQMRFLCMFMFSHRNIPTTNYKRGLVCRERIEQSQASKPSPWGRAVVLCLRRRKSK